MHYLRRLFVPYHILLHVAEWRHACIKLRDARTRKDKFAEEYWLERYEISSGMLAVGMSGYFFRDRP